MIIQEQLFSFSEDTKYHHKKLDIEENPVTKEELTHDKSNQQ